MAEAKEDNHRHKGSKRKLASVYDAVAGRVGYQGFLTEQRTSKHRDTTSVSDQAVPPEEVIFRRKGAPARYEEDDIYFADRNLRPDQRLPDSDLLKVMHAYAADYYAALPGDGGQHDFKSLDETALIAFGILIEEAAAASLGETGDLALVEGVTDGVAAPDMGKMYWNGKALQRSVIQQPQRRSSSRSKRTPARSSSTGG